VITGRCQCGAVRYEHSGPATAIYVCHCRECRRQSASAFGISVEVSKFGLRVTQGAPQFWTRDCGSRLWHEPESGADWLTLKGGSLDTPPDLSKAIHIWTSRKLPGVIIPEGAQQFPEEPV